MFKVVPDQLRVSDGWVRCGHCDEVFDANAHLIPSAVAGGQPPVQMGDRVSDAPYDWGPVTDPAATGGPAPAPHISLPDETVETAAAVVDAAAQEDSHVQPPVDPFLDQSPQELSESSPWSPTVEFEGFVNLQATDSQLGDSEPSFMVKAIARPRGLGSLSGGLMIFAAVVLAVTLLIQVLLQERDRIAAAQPALKSALEIVCIPFSCKVAPLHNIEAVVIDSSSFSKGLARVYTLQFALKNTSGFALATPAVELSLTDAQDAVVLRRVVLAEEFAERQAVLAAGGELTAKLSIQVQQAEGFDKISGYRLLVFYP